MVSSATLGLKVKLSSTDKYRPSRRQIRVLKLLPGKSDEPIRCTIRLVHLDGRQEYQALSYVWGPLLDTEKIEISGNSFRITRNLHTALLRLRHLDEQRSIWVDQLCINQLDNDDRSHQVSLMRDIYRQCSRCIIWLGEIEAESERFNLNDAWLVFKFFKFAADADSLELAHLPALFQNSFRGERVRNAFEAVSMYSNPWWSRVWTLQEAVVPSSGLFVWGPLSMSFTTMVTAAQNLQVDKMYELFSPSFCHLRLLHTPLLRRILYPLHGFQHANKHDGPLDMLMRWRHRDAIDPRDKVYALMGLMREDDLPSARGYNYNVAPSILFANVTFDLTNLEKGLRPLIGSCELPHKTPDQPSWAIDFANTNRIGRLQLKWWNHSHRYHEFTASAGHGLQASLLQDAKCLALKGVLVDEIEVTSDMYVLPDDTDIDPLTLCDTIIGWNKLLSDWYADHGLPEQYKTGGSTLSAFARTCIGDLIKAEFPIERAKPKHERRFFKLLTSLSECQTQNLLYESVCGMVPNHAFFVTKLGYIGIGPPEIQPGDQAWVIYGGRVPFILRTQEQDNVLDGAHAFTLVGDAYVHGIMDGQAVGDGHQAQNVWLY